MILFLAAAEELLLHSCFIYKLNFFCFLLQHTESERPTDYVLDACIWKYGKIYIRMSPRVDGPEQEPFSHSMGCFSSSSSGRSTEETKTKMQAGADYPDQHPVLAEADCNDVGINYLPPADMHCK